MTPEMIRIPGDDGLLVGRVPVTQGLYRSVMGSNPSDFSSCGDDCPVETVSWFNAIAFCNRLSEQGGLKPAYTIRGDDVTWDRSADGYRLPTEAEWEYAARAGKDTLYAGSDNIGEVAWYYSNSKEVAWYYSNSRGKTHSVGDKQANAWGLYDMSGNVWEWCWDLYEAHSSFRVVRGGSWDDGPRDARLARRRGRSPAVANCNLGFRLVRSV